MKNIKNKIHKSCNYCRAYTGRMCLLHFKIELLPKNIIIIDYTTKYNKFVHSEVFVSHKPLEICDRPRTIREMIIAQNKKWSEINEK
jgi:hypothetical protein